MPPAPSAQLIDCPACGRQLSAKAISCPQCGHPIAPVPIPAKPRTETRDIASLVSLVIVPLSLGAQGTVAKIISADNLREVGNATLLRVLVQTAPLTIAIMLIALAVIKKWWAETASIVFFAVVVLFISVFIGSWFGGLGSLPSMQGNLGTVFFKTLAFYWRHYGPGLFISSIVLGVFQAWMLAREWPRPREVELPARRGE